MRFGFFSTGILLLVVLGHLYLYRSLIRNLTANPKVRRWGGAAVLLLAVSLLAARSLGRYWASPGAQLLGTLSYVWMGLALFIVLALLVVDAVKLGLFVRRKVRALCARRAGSAASVGVDAERRHFLSRSLAGGALLTGTAVGSYGGWRAFHRPVLSEVPVRLPGLPKALDGFSIVQLTDIHVGNFIERRFMDELVRQANALRPDLVAVTGDLVDGTVPALGHAVAALSNLRSREGTYFVTGNHEYYSGELEWVDFLEGQGVKVLRNRTVRIGDAGGAFDLVGVDDWSGGKGRGRPGYDLDLALEGRSPDLPAVLLAHQPANFEVAAERGIGLQVSGHTHGGQLFPMTFFVALAWEYAAGLYRRGDSSIYVSRGCGFWGPPMRVGSPPEIVKLVLTA